MGLPKITTPEYSVKLFSLKTPVTFRPYLVKEEKLLLTAKQSEDPSMIVDAVIQVIKQCTFEKIAVQELPSFDLEYLFLQLRAKSVNNVIKLSYNCQNIIVAHDGAEPKRCNHVSTITVNLDEVTLTTTTDHTSTVTLNNEMVIEMRYPTIQLVRAHLTPNSTELTESSTIKVVAECLKTITEPDGKVYEARDYSLEERLEFIESMGISDLERFGTFFSNMPSLRHTVPFVCSKCQYTEPIVLEGLHAFF